VHIAWGSLLNVLLVSSAAAIAVVALISTALVALSGRRPEGGGDAVVSAWAKAIGGICLGAAGVIVFYGLYVIVAA
jgi:hypothetical protein